MDNSETPFVSIVIPVFNGEHTIGGCLKSLLALDYPSEQREIIVVDNGSTDRTYESVGRFPVQLLREPRRGCAAARNTGFRACRGEIIASTDADCLVSRGWVRELVKSFHDKEIGAVAGDVVSYPPHTPAERYAARVRHIAPRKYMARPILPFAAFANLAFRRHVLERIGPLDESIPLGESPDYCTRFLRESGLRLAYASNAVVFHRHRRTVWEFVQQQWKYGRGHAQLYIKYRREIPWGWRQRMKAYGDLCWTAQILGKKSAGYWLNKNSKDDLYFWYFEFLKKLAERLGFIRESLARGYFYL